MAQKCPHSSLGLKRYFRYWVLWYFCNVILVFAYSTLRVKCYFFIWYRVSPSLYFSFSLSFTLSPTDTSLNYISIKHLLSCGSDRYFRGISIFYDSICVVLFNSFESIHLMGPSFWGLSLLIIFYTFKKHRYVAYLFVDRQLQRRN